MPPPSKMPPIGTEIHRPLLQNLSVRHRRKDAAARNPHTNSKENGGMKSLQSTIQAHRRRTTTTATNMATVLEHYNDLKVKITAQISSGSFPANQMLQYQEMLYRIDVLETCMAFVKTEPVVYEGGGSDHRGVHQVMPVKDTSAADKYRGIGSEINLQLSEFVQNVGCVMGGGLPDGFLHILRKDRFMAAQDGADVLILRIYKHIPDGNHVGLVVIDKPNWLRTSEILGELIPENAILECPQRTLALNSHRLDLPALWTAPDCLIAQSSHTSCQERFSHRSGFLWLVRYTTASFNTFSGKIRSHFSRRASYIIPEGSEHPYVCENNAGTN